MGGSRFDAWTRRRFGIAAAGAAGALLGMASWDEGAARGKHKKKRQKRKRERLHAKQCEPLGTDCNPQNDQRLCCGGLICGHVPELGNRRCCHDRFGLCQRDADCCNNLQCVGDEERFCDIPA